MKKNLLRKKFLLLYLLGSTLILSSCDRNVTLPVDTEVITTNEETTTEKKADEDSTAYDELNYSFDEIVYDNNHYRPSYALNYKTLIEYRTQLGFN